MKNLVIFHMESLNNLIFFMNKELFPNIRKFLEYSTYYSNYYTTATSTLMVISDLLYGRTDQFESSSYLEDIYSIKPTAESLFDKLYNQGYTVKNYNIGNTIDFGKNGIEGYTRAISEKADYYFSKQSDDLIKDISVFISSDKPFMFFVRDDESHISEMNHFKTKEISSSYDLYSERYRKMDETFGKIVEEIKRNNKFDDTVFILYGDHGEELWGHHIYEGYVHAFEPYVNLCHCPLIVHSAGQKNCGDNNSLISTINLAELALNLINNSNYEKSISYAYTRNLFANQKLCLNRFNKSYSITNGKYLVLVSNQGIEMYMNKIDHAGTRNILDFFYMKDGSLQYNKCFNCLIASHYKYFMTNEFIQEVKKEFAVLQKELQKYLSGLYGKYQKSQMNFNKIRYSIDSRNELKILHKRYFRERLSSIVKKMTHLTNNKEKK